MNKSDDFWKALEGNMPVTFPRRRVSELTGGLLSARVMANLDSQGKGPSIKIQIGKHINYQRENFLDWLKSRVS